MGRSGRAPKLLAVAALAVAALAFGGCDWPMSAFDAALTHASFDHNINQANASTIRQLFISPGQFGPPVESNGVVYAADTVAPAETGGYLEAFDANGTTNCSGTPNACSPLWTGQITGGNGSAPAVAKGVVYVTTSPMNTTAGSLYAFDANGVTNCSGTPKVCQPLWTAPAGASTAPAPTVANGVVYVSSDMGNHDLEAFDANGSTNCAGTPKVCQPLWTASAGGSIPAVANGVVYVSSAPFSTIPGTLYAFSANGTTNCSGTPTTCVPLWSAAMGTTSTQVPPSPAVSGGVVYDESADGTLYAFDAGGDTNCSGTPTTCTPSWTAALSAGPQYGSSPAVANGVVYATGGNLEAFDANGTTNCAGTPKTCTPLWSYNVTGSVGLSSPSVANGLVFIGSGTGSSSSGSNFMAFDANGKTDCSGTPAVCNPLWTGATTGLQEGSAAVANGKIYVADNSFTFFATHLYAWVLPPPTTTVWLPSNGATVSGTQGLDAGASAGVTQVQYVLTGGSLNHSVIATATSPTYYGWTASFDSTKVPNGIYTLQSVASYGGEVTGTSPGVTVTVSN